MDNLRAALLIPFTVVTFMGVVMFAVGAVMFRRRFADKSLRLCIATSQLEVGMRILDLALKDLSQIFRDKRSLLFLIVMPIGFTFFMGFAYRSADKNTDADNRIVAGGCESRTGRGAKQDAHWTIGPIRTTSASNP